MKREFLKEMGLTDEQIDKVMSENGKDVEKAKGDLEKVKNDLQAKETELDTTKVQLNTANETIESYKSMDIEAIKKSAEEYKFKFEEAQKKAKADMEKLQFDHALENALNKAGAKNTKAVKALINLEGLKLNKDEIIGLKEQLEKIKEENDYLFGETEPTGTGGSIGGGAKLKQTKENNSKTDFINVIKEVQAKRQ